MSSEQDSPEAAAGRRLSDFFTPQTAKKAGFIGACYPGSDLVSAEDDSLLPGSPDPVVTGLEYDSRKVKPGNLFFAFPGIHADGHAFIADAVNWGAEVIIHQEKLSSYKDWVTYIRVKDARLAMSAVADAFYGYPSRHMAVIGVTGTEGKSTTVYLIYQLLKLSGLKAGFISTVRQGDGKTEIPNPEHQTTPEAVTVHRLLAEMRRNGAEIAVVEASSHGLSKKTGRLGDVSFDAGVMTNVNHEHLEFHGTWEQYRNDKAELFRALDASSHAKLDKKSAVPGKPAVVPSFGVVNADDPSASYFTAATKHKTYTYSARGADADLSLRIIESGAGGNWYEVYVASTGEAVIIRDQLPGAFNVGNVLAALLTVSLLISAPVTQLAPLVPQLKPVRGRMTALRKGQPFEVLVDYAHTPSSFEAVFPPLRERLSSEGRRIISVFGSAGERDTKKRSEQGRIAARYSDIVILTDEDPRGEDPLSILEEIAKGCEADQGCEAYSGSEADQGRENKIRGKDLFLIPGRPAAIRKAFSLAEKGDMVLLLGKGHENSIIYAKETIPYDEIAEAEKALEEMGYSGRAND